MTAPNFPGFKNNSADFQGKRDQRASPLNFIDVDLSVARSAALGNILNLQIGGNLFYVDQNPDIGGFATVFFGDGTVRGGTPIYVGSGFLSNADFVELGFSNVAQPGKILRVVYGTDVNFKPQFGSVQNVVVGNTAPLNVNVLPNLGNLNISSATYVASTSATFTVGGHAFVAMRSFLTRLAITRVRYVSQNLTGPINLAFGLCDPSNEYKGVFAAGRTSSMNINIPNFDEPTCGTFEASSASLPQSFTKIITRAETLYPNQPTQQYIFENPVILNGGHTLVVGANSSPNSGTFSVSYDFKIV
jgi:hypothetical protein